jgi:hypothetical protein
MTCRLLCLPLLLATVLAHAEDLDFADPSAALREAVTCRQGKQYERALLIHVWMQDRSLDRQPSFYGVRLSFALAEWKELAKDYPPAQQAIDARFERLAEGFRVSGKRETFHDLVSIAQYFGKEQRIIAMLQDLSASNPAVAKEVAEMADRLLLQMRQYDLYRSLGLDDPKKIDRAIETYKRHQGMREKVGDASLADRMLVYSLGTYFAYLKEMGDQERIRAYKEKLVQGGIPGDVVGKL